jgi:hypothetical protein
MNLLHLTWIAVMHISNHSDQLRLVSKRHSTHIIPAIKKPACLYSGSPVIIVGGQGSLSLLS